MKINKYNHPVSHTLVLISFYLLTIFSCDKENLTQDNDPCLGTSYTYRDDVAKIFTTSCAKSGCHDGSNGLKDYSKYEGVFQDKNTIQRGIRLGLETITNGRAQLSVEEKQLILCWINRGAPE